ncbi:hypothetical protein EI555_007445, partial [Monodon monoceros]
GQTGVMGTSQSKPDPKTPLGCLLANFTALDFSQDLCCRRLIFYSIILLAKQTSPTPSDKDSSSPLTDPPNLLLPPPFRPPPPYPEAVPPSPEAAPATAPPPPPSVPLPTSLPSPISAYTRSHDSQDPNIRCPLREVHLTDNSMPVGVTAVPGTNPGWTYQDGQDGRLKRDLMIQCLLAVVQAAAHKARMHQKVALQTQALVAALRPAIFHGSQHPWGPQKATPPGACFKCGKEGHWACQCPNPQPPSKPCPSCRLTGHWKSDCPTTGPPSVSPRGGQANPAALPLELLGLAND